MMPVLTHIEHPFHGQISPELRRMDMINRARREEMEVMLFGLNPRHTVGKTGSSPRSRESLLGRMVSGMRAAVGSSLIAAGNRINTAA
jgi:hypothetical protein